MQHPPDILKTTAHRPFPLPERPWKYYQDWLGTLFLHYRVPAEVLRPLLPAGLALDTHNGEAWASVVAFTVKNMRPRFLPPFPYVSDFHEVNLRTYVIKDGKPGIYFISVEANKLVPVLAARYLIGIKYKTAKIERNDLHYVLTKSSENNLLDVHYKSGQNIAKTELEKWLTERYCAYEQINGKLYRFDIHHKEWLIQDVDIKQLNVQYKKKSLLIDSTTPHLAHYSPEQNVLFWARKKC